MMRKFIFLVLSLISFTAQSGEFLKDASTKCRVWVDNPIENRTSVKWSGSCYSHAAGGLYVDGQGELTIYLDNKIIENYIGETRAGYYQGFGTRQRYKSDLFNEESVSTKPIKGLWDNDVYIEKGAFGNNRNNSSSDNNLYLESCEVKEKCRVLAPRDTGLSEILANGNKTRKKDGRDNLELHQSNSSSKGGNWGLKLKFNNNGNGFPTRGQFEFRDLNCGGDFQTTQINKSESKVVLSQNMTYGKCVKGCSIVLTNGLKNYFETCNSQYTGGGNFQQTGDIDNLLNLFIASSDFEVTSNIASTPSPSTTTATNTNQSNSNYGICKNPSIPNPNPLENETLEFYGVCDQSNRAMTGLVVFKLNDTAYSIDCLSSGNYGDTIGKFDACESYWTSLQNYCKVDNYKGQCIQGVPNGVGQIFHQEYDHIKGEGLFNILAATFGNQVVAADTSIGMFANGELDGYGDYFSVSGCGMAGCSGNRIKKHGWFEKGEFKFACSNIIECSKKVSGKAFTSKFKAKKSSLQAASSVSNGDFQSYLSSFEETGNISDLREAKKLAKTKSEKAALEFNILRTAGYEKVFSLKTIITNGNKSVDASDSQKLLGFFRTVDSSIPIKVKWSIKPLSSVMTLKDGIYNTKLRVGLSVNKNIDSCLGSFCQKNKDVDNYEKLIDVTLSPNNKYSANGVYELSVVGTSTTVMFGVASVNDITDIESIIAIDSVELAQ